MKNAIIPSLLIAVSTWLSACATTDVEAPPMSIKEGPNGALSLWSEEDKKHIPVETFWRQYADTKGGLTWGEGREYPEYEKVKEFDTFLVEVDQGKCLMEFFHSRWRRAQDVRRWDPQYNQLLGCPHVFD